jgi:hypothetical protein
MKLIKFFKKSSEPVTAAVKKPSFFFSETEELRQKIEAQERKVKNDAIRRSHQVAAGYIRQAGEMRKKSLSKRTEIERIKSEIGVTNDPIYAEILRRMLPKLEAEVKDLEKEAAELEKTAANFLGDQIDPGPEEDGGSYSVGEWSYLPDPAEEAAKIERRQIFEEGEIIHESIAGVLATDDITEEVRKSRSIVPHWENYVRRIVLYRDRIFLCHLSREVVPELINSFQREEMGWYYTSHMETIEVYKSSGKYTDGVVDWVTESPSQMTDGELIAIVEWKQKHEE